MSSMARILLIGTADTKSAELLFVRERIEALGGTTLLMDVGVLQSAQFEAQISNHRVAQAAGTTLADIIAGGDENAAMMAMARGATQLATQLCQQNAFDGLLALGGTMGTDLALDVAAALPLGVPKVLLSTIAHSHLIPSDRVAPELIMMLWAGGLYGLNSLCRSSLSQAAGAVVGACRAAMPPSFDKPIIGMTSLGSSGLKYMLYLTPALQQRGYEVTVFHTTGMGGHAFETLAAEKRFAAVFDFSLQELANHVVGSCVSAGPTRMHGAALAGIPQLIAPGAVDMVDFQTWGPVPDAFATRPFHAHNRLIASVSSPADTRRRVARALKERLSLAQGPTCLLLPLQGVEEWDRSGQPLHDPVGLQAFFDEMRDIDGRVERIEVNAHINDKVFSDTALEVFDRWVAQGKVPPGAR